jgi:hypothetical protein
MSNSLVTPTGTNAEILSNHERLISPLERVRLGGDELAICAVVDLNPPNTNESAMPRQDVYTERLVVLDVGFRTTTDGKYGPYDVDGSGEKRTFEKPYVIINSREEEDPEDKTRRIRKTYLMEADDDEQIKIGRMYPSATKLGFADNDRISSNHATITFDRKGAIHIRDVGSTNGTKIQSAQELIGQPNVEFDYTVNIAHYVHAAGRGDRYVPKEKEEGWGYGFYADRPVIARDTPLNGGVYPVGGTKGEAIVIDDKRYPEALDRVYNSLLEKLEMKSPEGTAFGGIKRLLRGRNNEISGSSTGNIMKDVLDIAIGVLKYDLKATNAIAANGQKVSLTEYIEEGIGVCRTQGILCAYLLERLVKDGRIEGGAASIDRNSTKEMDGVSGGHAWARFRDGDGNIYIIDPAQKFSGRIDDLKGDTWDYLRTEDHIKKLLTS